MPNRDGTLKAREFLFYTEDLALAALPPAFPRPERRLMWTILQLHYGEPSVHFELQPRPSRGLVELGLHFEGAPEANEAGAQLVAAQTHAIRAALGPDWELEEWTASWRRLHRTFPIARLTAALGQDVAAQFSDLLQVLQPVLSQAGLWEPIAAVPRGAAPSRDSRHRRFSRR